MKSTLKISEELERKGKETIRVLEEEADDYHEHTKHQRLQIDKVIHEGNEIESSKDEEEEDVGTKYIMETFDANLEEDLAR